MKPSDRPELNKRLAMVYSFYRVEWSEDARVIWWETMRPFDLELVKRALNAHSVDTDRGQFLPKPADVIKLLDELRPDGRPGPEEAWAMVASALHDERVTLVMTEEMQQAQALANSAELSPIAARMVFLEKYKQLVKSARLRGGPPVWVKSLGWDANLRAGPLLEAVRLGRLKQEDVQEFRPRPPLSHERLSLVKKLADKWSDTP